jgi:hypothetical protein
MKLPKDFNPAIHIMDLLTEDDFSPTEIMADIGGIFGRYQIAETMRYLIEQELVQISSTADDGNSGRLTKEQQLEFTEQFEMLLQNYGNLPSIGIQLTDQGLLVMKLMGIGDPGIR